MKRLLCVLLTIAVLLTLGFPAAAIEDDHLLILSELSDEDLMAFLVENGVRIPAVFVSDDECHQFIRKTINTLSQDSNAHFYYGHVPLQHFAEAIASVYRTYYGVENRNTRTKVYGTEDIVEDSVVLGPWNSSYGTTNCYAYAIGCSYAISPGYLVSEYDPNGPVLDIMYPTLLSMVNWVIDDLEFLKYTNINYGTDLLIPLTGINEHTRFICIRRATYTSGDFHFMVLEEDGNWYHKPGQTVPLRYKYTPESSRVWVGEGLDEHGYFRDNDTVYASDIYFISYSIPCEYSYKYCGNDRHIQTCTECDKTTGNASPCRYVNRRCSYCGHTQISGGIIQSVYVNMNQ